jgi:hypothetical protein
MEENEQLQRFPPRSPQILPALDKQIQGVVLPRFILVDVSDHFIKIKEVVN